MHSNQFWWVRPLRYRRFCSFLDLAKFPFLTIDHEGQKIELAQKIHASRC